MNVNNNSLKTGQPKQPLNNQESLQKATREELIKIFDLNSDNTITIEEQREVIKGYLSEEYQKYDEGIVNESIESWTYKN